MSSDNVANNGLGDDYEYVDEPPLLPEHNQVLLLDDNLSDQDNQNQNQNGHFDDTSNQVNDDNAKIVSNSLHKMDSDNTFIKNNENIEENNHSLDQAAINLKNFNTTFPSENGHTNDNERTRGQSASFTDFFKMNDNNINNNTNLNNDNNNNNNGNNNNNEIIASNNLEDDSHDNFMANVKYRKERAQSEKNINEYTNDTDELFAYFRAVKDEQKDKDDSDKTSYGSHGEHKTKHANGVAPPEFTQQQQQQQQQEMPSQSINNNNNNNTVTQNGLLTVEEQQMGLSATNSASNNKTNTEDNEDEDYSTQPYTAANQPRMGVAPFNSNHLTHESLPAIPTVTYDNSALTPNTTLNNTTPLADFSMLKQESPLQTGADILVQEPPTPSALLSPDGKMNSYNFVDNNNNNNNNIQNIMNNNDNLSPRAKLQQSQQLLQNDNHNHPSNSEQLNKKPATDLNNMTSSQFQQALQEDLDDDEENSTPIRHTQYVQQQQQQQQQQQKNSLQIIPTNEQDLAAFVRNSISMNNDAARTKELVKTKKNDDDDDDDDESSQSSDKNEKIHGKTQSNITQLYEKFRKDKQSFILQIEELNGQLTQQDIEHREQTESLTAQIEELNRKYEEKEEELNDIDRDKQNEIDQLNDVNRGMAHDISFLKKEIIENKEQAKNEIEQLLNQNHQLQEHLHEYEEKWNFHQQQCPLLNDHLKNLKEDEIAKMIQEERSHQEVIDEQKEELIELNKRINELEQNHTEDASRLADFSNQMEIMINEKENMIKELSSLQGQLKEVRLEKERILQDRVEIERKLEELTNEHELLINFTEEQSNLIDRAEAVGVTEDDIAQIKSKRSLFVGNRQPSRSVVNSYGNLSEFIQHAHRLSNMSEQLMKKEFLQQVQQEPVEQAKSEYSESSASSIRTRYSFMAYHTHDALKEFFFLTALCVKLSLAALYGVSPDVAPSNGELWKLCTQNGILFHEYYDYIYNELTPIYEHKLQQKQNLLQHIVLTNPNQYKKNNKTKTLSVEPIYKKQNKEQNQQNQHNKQQGSLSSLVSNNSNNNNNRTLLHPNELFGGSIRVISREERNRKLSQGSIKSNKSQPGGDEHLQGSSLQPGLGNNNNNNNDKQHKARGSQSDLQINNENKNDQNDEKSPSSLNKHSSHHGYGHHQKHSSTHKHESINSPHDSHQDQHQHHGHKHSSGSNVSSSQGKKHSRVGSNLGLTVSEHEEIDPLNVKHDKKNSFKIIPSNKNVLSNNNNNNNNNNNVSPKHEKNPSLQINLQLVSGGGDISNSPVKSPSSQASSSPLGGGSSRRAKKSVVWQDQPINGDNNNNNNNNNNNDNNNNSNNNNNIYDDSQSNYKGDPLYHKRLSHISEKQDLEIKQDDELL